ncbi:MAG: hypothetical protein EZS28_025660, partial [Streblomastix strix]
IDILPGSEISLTPPSQVIITQKQQLYLARFFTVAAFQPLSHTPYTSTIIPPPSYRCATYMVVKIEVRVSFELKLAARFEWRRIWRFLQSMGLIVEIRLDKSIRISVISITAPKKILMNIAHVFKSSCCFYVMITCEGGVNEISEPGNMSILDELYYQLLLLI